MTVKYPDHHHETHYLTSIYCESPDFSGQNPFENSVGLPQGGHRRRQTFHHLEQSLQDRAVGGNVRVADTQIHFGQRGQFVQMRRH